MIALGLGINAAGSIRPGVPFSRWFLASGSWDDDGLWSDRAVLWDAPWFLAAGIFRSYGVWDDTQELWT